MWRTKTNQHIEKTGFLLTKRWYFNNFKRPTYMQKRIMSDLLRCPGASSPSSGLSNLKTIRLPALMRNINKDNSFNWPIIPSLWKRPRHWHSLGASRWFSESCHFSSALRRYWNLILVSELLAGWLWDSKDVLLLRSNYPPAVSFPQAQDETQKRLCAPKVIR